MWGKETPPVNQHLRTISWSAPLQQEALWDWQLLPVLCFPCLQLCCLRGFQGPLAFACLQHSFLLSISDESTLCGCAWQLIICDQSLEDW